MTVILARNKKLILYAGLLITALQPSQTHAGSLSKFLKNFRSCLWVSLGGTGEIHEAFQKVNDALLFGAYVETDDWMHEAMEKDLRQTILAARLGKIKVDIDLQGARLQEIIQERNAAQDRVANTLKNACTDLKEICPKISGTYAEEKFAKIAAESQEQLSESIPHISREAYAKIGEYCGFDGFDLEKEAIENEL